MTYKIEIFGIDIPKAPVHEAPWHELRETLQQAYDNGAAGTFFIYPTDEQVRIVFERSCSDDAPYLEERRRKGVDAQRAAMEQLADELAKLGHSGLSQIVAKLREGAASVFGLTGFEYGPQPVHTPSNFFAPYTRGGDLSGLRAKRTAKAP